MIRRFLFKLTGRLPCRLIGRDGMPYLERYFLFRFFGITAYLHRFVDCDGDNELHDHPWTAVSIGLAGGYLEERIKSIDLRYGIAVRLRRFRFFNFIRAGDFHRIATIAPDTWTLFIHGPYQKTWGFLQMSPPGNPTNPNAHPENLAINYHQPYDLSSGDNTWWKRVPKGKSAGRQPMQGIK